MKIAREVWTLEHGCVRLEVWCTYERSTYPVPPAVLDDEAERFRRAACALLGVESVVVQHVINAATNGGGWYTAPDPGLSTATIYRPGGTRSACCPSRDLHQAVEEPDPRRRDDERLLRQSVRAERLRMERVSEDFVAYPEY